MWRGLCRAGNRREEERYEECGSKSKSFKTLKPAEQHRAVLGAVLWLRPNTNKNYRPAVIQLSSSTKPGYCKTEAPNH